MFESVRKRLASWIAPAPGRAVRMYASARGGRLTGGWNPSNTSADGELTHSLTALRNRARALVRDAAYAKRAKVIVVNNVIGPGIGLQAQVSTTRGELNERINAGIEEAFYEWARPESCHTGGVLHFCDFERAAMGQIFEAGEVFIRKHYRPFGNSRVPLALELIEGERLPDTLQPGVAMQGNTIRMGVEVDRFHRPVAYWIRELHPGELHMGLGQADRFERVPADQVYHLKITDRWPQSRGEPWMHAVMRKLNDMDGYSEAEIVAARGAASYVWWIKTPENPDSTLTTEAPDGSREMAVEPGLAKWLAPGEDIIANNPNRPNANMDPFMRLMLREVAAGGGTSYESLSRDYSQTTYSSGRLAMVDDRDLWRGFQRWFIRSFREPFHREWMQAAVYSGAIPAVPVAAYVAEPARYEYVRFKPRGWSWIDPSVEVESFKSAIRAGMTTLTDVIAQTGNGDDIEDVLERRARELVLKKQMEQRYGIELNFDTDPDRLEDGAPADPPKPEAAPPPKPEEKEDEAARTLRAVSFGG